MESLLNLAEGITISENLVHIFSAAEALARERGHKILGTEHVVYCMLGRENRAIRWIARKNFPESNSPIADLRRMTIDWLDSRVMFQPQPEDVTDMLLSEALIHSMQVARQIGKDPIRDGDIIHQNGLIASEFFLAGLLAEGTGVGAEALVRSSAGRVNSLSLLQAIGVDPARLSRPDTSHGAWNEFTSSTSPSCLAPWSPGSSLPNLAGLPPSPTHSSNWLVPEHLIIGSQPSSRDATQLVAAGVTTFVCLIGDYGHDTDYYRTRRYPAAFLNTNNDIDTHLTFLHFPIADFEVTSCSNLARFVGDLKRRLLGGQCLFVHCAGGHG